MSKKLILFENTAKIKYPHGLKIKTTWMKIILVAAKHSAKNGSLDWSKNVKNLGWQRNSHSEAVSTWLIDYCGK